MAEKKIFFLPNGIDFVLEDEEGRRRYFERKFVEAQEITKKTGRPTAVNIASGHISFTDVQPELECPICDVEAAAARRRRLP